MIKQGHPQFSDARVAGRAAVFAEIRQNPSIARVDIARSTGLSPATVTSITSGMIAAKLIEEVQADNVDIVAKRGRPRVNLKVRGEAHYVVGVSLSERSAELSFLDFAGNKISDFEHPASQKVYTPVELLKFLDEALMAGLAKSPISQSDLSGFGLGIAGVVDAETGIVLWSPVLAEDHVLMQQILSDHFNMPAFIDNDTNLVTVAEHRIGLAQNARNFAVVTIEQGVGLGIYLNNKIYRGTRGRGAELGHTKVQLDGALCRCGQRGCLEAYVGDYALLHEAGVAMVELSGETTPEKITSLLDAAQSGNKAAQSIIRRSNLMFFMGLANVINIFAPEMVILSGERLQSNFFSHEDVVANIKQFTVQLGDMTPEIKIHKWDNQMWSLGAAIFAIDGVIEKVLGDFS